ncbi:flagellar protein FlaG [Methylomonas sp. SURF-2]|uniref:Flagellar protein FlaG n=1 Tax=Methylomonas subterranea TaxID=2952225 RepID=A0ABT1TBM5_9GAMM|nr:flagellar protein FlaG [Methylomonas sp. SURF-2]MCQ8102846.1 flagellar protein FlaG [Methylomonas sp. SURF-2]
MSSEISNVLKLSPVTVVNSNSKKELQHANPTNVTKKNQSQEPAKVQGDSQMLADPQNEKAKAESDLGAVKQAVEKGNSLFQAAQRSLQFEVDDATKEVVVKIIDSDSGEVVRQIPAEETLEFVKRMQELEGQQGSMLQDRA